MRVRLPDGRPGVLTTQHASSSHGLPVVVVDGQAFGPGEVGELEVSVAVRRQAELLAAAQRAGFRIAGVPDPLRELRSRGGRAKSPARAAAARENGRRGGRPKKSL